MPLKEFVLSQPYDLARAPIGLDDKDLVDTDALIRFIRKRGRLCLGWLVAGLCTGILYGMATPAHYTATANILLEDHSAKSPDAPVGETDAAHSTYVETQVQVLGSDEVVGRIVDDQHLADDIEFGGTGGGLRALLVKDAPPCSRLLRIGDANQPSICNDRAGSKRAVRSPSWGIGCRRNPIHLTGRNSFSRNRQYSDPKLRRQPPGVAAERSRGNGIASAGAPGGTARQGVPNRPARGWRRFGAQLRTVDEGTLSRTAAKN